MPDYRNPPYDSWSEGSLPKSEGDAFGGISMQVSQDWLIRIDPHLRGATIGDAGWRPTEISTAKLTHVYGS
jgi:hypothetical protein